MPFPSCLVGPALYQFSQRCRGTFHGIINFDLLTDLACIPNKSKGTEKWCSEGRWSNSDQQGFRHVYLNLSEPAFLCVLFPLQSVGGVWEWSTVLYSEALHLAGLCERIAELNLCRWVKKCFNCVMPGTWTELSASNSPSEVRIFRLLHVEA